jgi:hypothetical protein
VLLLKEIPLRRSFQTEPAKPLEPAPAGDSLPEAVPVAPITAAVAGRGDRPQDP